MAGINEKYDPSITILSRGVVEIKAVYNNHFIRRVFIGLPYTKALKQFDKDIRKGKY